MSKKSDVERIHAIDRLRAMLKPGDTVFTVLRRVSSSGMSRDIDLYILSENEPVWLSGLAARAMGERMAKDQGIRVSGAGMDMGLPDTDVDLAMWPHWREFVDACDAVARLIQVTTSEPERLTRRDLAERFSRKGTG